MRKKALGEQELALLRYITEQGGATVGETVEGFGESHHLTRSTVVTMMDRLRDKGYLSRVKGDDGVYCYRPSQPQEELVEGLISGFIERTLGGRMTALTAYFTRSEKLSEEEKAELKRLLDKMEDRPNG